ncbi:conserved hypothetical protein [Leishmania mexicana MHOM/GT/2001/U1103]|uniref:Uncharacterized protein n=1 Tax=Leishmania mexicana (strain MHOM/GT/2001/U1103) TaxID=929439 RepID=E9B5J7_LEIMU|nr:conserved hypothetical protein [Leishmania mexicana MHOM/GT/2001/U1103]CBZ30517.1 conserved hypothetical protein [Leishmania mexicana MHOM/GT/2001/U1103]
MRRAGHLSSLRLVRCTAVLFSNGSRPPAPPLSALITGSRHFCIGATRRFYAPPRRLQAASPSSASHPTVKTGGAAWSEEGALESPPPSAEARAASAAVAVIASASAADASAQPRLPPLQDSLTRRLFASWQQGVVASIGAVMGIGFLLFFLYTPVKEDTVHHTAVVASEALADARLKGQAVQLSKDVVLEVLRNPKSLEATVDVVVELLAREETKIAVSSLLQSLFEDHYTQEVTKKFVLRVVQDPWIQDQLQMITEEQVRKLLNNAAIKTELSKFLLKAAVDSLEKPQLHYEVAKAMRHSVASLVNFWWT